MKKNMSKKNKTFKSVSYSSTDTWGNLRNSQLKLIAESDHRYVIGVLKEYTYLDH